ncbi:MAG: RNA polymerase sigma factor [Acidobacteria bacterium]|nr:RNA polymerase sigma factor [Acidobacteriota bacterium]
MSGKRGAVPEPAQSDRELVKRMLAGEEHAFAEFFDGYFSRLYRFALPRLGQDAGAAEEVVQAALCRAISALKSWRGEAALFTWLCTFCRHEISAHYRGGERRQETTGLIEDVQAMPAPDEGRGNDVARLVHSTLDGLPDRYGDVLEWKYILGLSVGEIAARLEVSAKAAESLLTRARQAFREAFPAFERPGTKGL